VSGLHCSIPKGASAPGNVSLGPSIALPDVPISVSTSATGSGELSAAIAVRGGASAKRTHAAASTVQTRRLMAQASVRLQLRPIHTGEQLTATEMKLYMQRFREPRCANHQIYQRLQV